MAGRVRCPECRSVFPLPEDRDGEFFCPRCGKRLVVPGAGSRPKHKRGSEPEHDYVPAYEVRRAPAQRSRTRREEEWDEGESFGRVRRKAGRSRLIWLIVGLGTPMLIGVAVIAAIQIEKLLHPGAANPPPVVAAPPPVIFNGRGMVPQAAADPPDANAALTENVIGRFPQHTEEILDDASFGPPEKDPPAAALPAEIAAADVQKVKQATVMLRVQAAGRLLGEGSGFFAGEPGVIVTNAHVVGMLRPGVRQPRQIDVIAFSGEANEQKLSGTVVGLDRSADLAVLRVPKAPSLPAPLAVRSARELSEVQKVYIFGFPFGSQLGKQITVSTSTISQLRKDADGKINRIQVNGGMHPGNSGGPMVDARGDVVGVSVAVIKGTQINFAVPGDFVRAALHGRVLSARVGHPFKNGDALEMSYELRLLDPLQKARGAKVEYWYGLPGAARAQAAAQPAPLAGDGPHQIADLAHQDGTARGVLHLSAAPRDKVLYTRPVLANAAGETVWGTARASRVPATLERKPALLALRNEPAKRRLVLDTSSGWDYPGTNCDWRVEAHLEEQVQRQAGGSHVSLLHKRVRVAPFANGAFAADGGQVAQAARALSNTVVVTALDASGNPGLLRMENPWQGNFVLKRDIDALHGQLSDGFRLASPALPNRLVNPNDTWTGERVISLGGTTVILDLSYAYEGTRTLGGREEAVIRVAGSARAVPAQGKPSTATARGGAVFDLAAGQVTSAKIEVDLELDVIHHEGAAPVPATGTVIAHLTRTAAPIPEQFRQLLRVENEITAADPKDKLQPGHHKIFTVSMKAGSTYMINMVDKDAAAKRGAFDPYLRLEDAQGETVAEDDDSGGALNAQILFQPAVDGEYRIIATTFGPDQLGHFLLTVEEG